MKTTIKQVIDKKAKPREYIETSQDVTVYISDDGKEFLNEELCLLHEQTLQQTDVIIKKYNFKKSEYIITDPDDGIVKAFTVNLSEEINGFTLVYDISKINYDYSIKYCDYDITFNDIEIQSLKDITLNPGIFRFVFQRFEIGRAHV